MDIQYVIGITVYENQIVAVRSVDENNQVVDVKREKLPSITDETLLSLSSFDLFVHGERLVNEYELRDNQFAYDGSEDKELVSHLEKRLFFKQKDLEADAEKTVYHVVANLLINHEFVKMGGFIAGTDKEEARFATRAYCMERYNCGLGEVFVLDMVPTEYGIRQVIQSISKKGYANLPKHTYQLVVEAPLYDPKVKEFVPQSFSAEIQAISQKEAEYDAKDIYAHEFNTDADKITILDITKK